MKKIFTILSLAATTGFYNSSVAQTNIRIFDNVLFYGGYGDTTVFQEPAPAGVVRLKTSLFTKKITDAELAQIGTGLSMRVLAKPVCDNYDRAGHVSLALVPKGAERYAINDTAVKRLEIARFITPFMDRNVMPDTIEYNYEISNVASILKEKSITDVYDIWMELEIFGVAIDALPGCSGLKQVWHGTVDLKTNGATSIQNNNILKPLGNQLAFNNYQANATDAVGTTEKTLNFTLEGTSYNTQIVLIMSNHGANANGEEYNRRDHFVYFDGNQVLQFKPGETSCEPYRQYNTQSNGIYGGAPKSDAQWQSFSNWCPGAAIPTRTINLGTVQAGAHAFKIKVPDAQFVGQQGNFPLSVYVQGKTENITGIEDVQSAEESTSLCPNPAQSQISIRTKNKMNEVRLFNMLGQEIYKGNSAVISVEGLQKGVYYVKIKLAGNTIVTKSFIKN